MECECGSKEFRFYNKEKGVLHCVECGQLKDLEEFEGGIVECDGCGYVSKEHADKDVCPFCDGGKMETVVA